MRSRSGSSPRTGEVSLKVGSRTFTLDGSKCNRSADPPCCSGREAALSDLVPFGSGVTPAARRG
jgi:hypothetical protein